MSEVSSLSLVAHRCSFKWTCCVNFEGQFLHVNGLSPLKIWRIKKVQRNDLYWGRKEILARNFNTHPLIAPETEQVFLLLLLNAKGNVFKMADYFVEINTIANKIINRLQTDTLSMALIQEAVKVAQWLTDISNVLTQN